MVLIWTGDFSPRVSWTLTTLLLMSWLWISYALREKVIRPLQTLANMLAALAEGDYSIRARGARDDDVLGLAILELNALSETLRGQRLTAVEAEALLRRVMDEIEVAVFAFDDQHELRLVNRAGEKFLGRDGEEILGSSASALGLESCLDGDTPRIVDMTFQQSGKRWELRRSYFRQDGLPHSLIVLSDLSRVLREEERQTWKRLIRVLSHEINNSLAPIKSIAGALQNRVRAVEDLSSIRDDINKGLNVVSGRSEALNRFMSSYAQLARLPAPDRAPVDVDAWVHRVAGLEHRSDVVVEPGPPVTIMADGDQLDQVLINLVKNAVDACRETNGKVEVGWRVEDDEIAIYVRDEGPGIRDTHNIFVPFFTTKPKGTGIGLVLSRQIAEGHDGSLELENRSDRSGCLATLRLPIGEVPEESSEG